MPKLKEAKGPTRFKNKIQKLVYLDPRDLNPHPDNFRLSDELCGRISP